MARARTNSSDSVVGFGHHARNKVTQPRLRIGLVQLSLRSRIDDSLSMSMAKRRMPKVRFSGTLPSESIILGWFSVVV